MSELAVGTIDRPRPLRDLENLVDLSGHQRVHRMATRSTVGERADITSTLPPAMHPVIGHLPQRTHPRVRVAAGNRVVDDLEDQLLRLSADARGDRAGQAQPDFPRTTASSIACAVIAVRNCSISARAASSSQFRSLAGRPGLRANAANAASFAVRRIPITVDTSTCHLRAASAWEISPDVTCKNTSHFVSGDNTLCLRVGFSDINSSSRMIREACQPWGISTRDLRGEVRRKPATCGRCTRSLSVSLN